MGDIVHVRQALAPAMAQIEPILEQLLPPALPPERLLQTLYVSVANNAALSKAALPSLIQAATSAAVLALEVDGVTGQGYLVPFKGQAQFLTGYKGMVTLAGRGQRTLEGFLVREGERFEFDEAAGTWRHPRVLGGEPGRRVVGAYAVSRSRAFPTLLRVMSIDQLLEVRNASAGWKAKGARSTWGTYFGPMCRKTPMRRLALDTPVLSLLQAAAIEAQHDLGRHAYLHHDGGVVIDGHEHDPADLVREARDRDAVQADQPGAGHVLDGELDGEWIIHAPGRRDTNARDVRAYERKLIKSIDRCPDDELAAFIEANGERLRRIREEYPDVADRIDLALDERRA